MYYNYALGSPSGYSSVMSLLWCPYSCELVRGMAVPIYGVQVLSSFALHGHYSHFEMPLIPRSLMSNCTIDSLTTAQLHPHVTTTLLPHSPCDKIGWIRTLHVIRRVNTNLSHLARQPIIYATGLILQVFFFFTTLGPEEVHYDNDIMLKELASIATGLGFP